MPASLCRWLLRCHHRGARGRSVHGARAGDLREPHSSASLTEVPPSCCPMSDPQRQEPTLTSQWDTISRTDPEPLGDNRTHQAPSVLKTAAVCAHRNKHILQAWIRFYSPRSHSQHRCPKAAECFIHGQMVPCHTT